MRLPPLVINLSRSDRPLAIPAPNPPCAIPAPLISNRNMVTTPPALHNPPVAGAQSQTSPTPPRHQRTGQYAPDAPGHGPPDPSPGMAHLPRPRSHPAPVSQRKSPCRRQLPHHFIKLLGYGGHVPALIARVLPYNARHARFLLRADLPRRIFARRKVVQGFSPRPGLRSQTRPADSD